MKVTLKLYAMLSMYLPPGTKDNQIDIEVEDNATPASVLAKFMVPPENCHLVLNGVGEVHGTAGKLPPSPDQRVFVAPGQRELHRLNENDAVAVWPPIAGGRT